VADGHVGLAEGHAAGFDQLGHLGELFALEADGEGADRIDVGSVELLGPVAQHLDEAGLVEHGVGVGRNGEAGDAAGHGGVHLGFEGGLVFEAGLAQAGGEVDQAGRDDQATGVDGAGGAEAGGRLAHADDLAVGDVEILLRVEAVGRVDDPAIRDVDVHGRKPVDQ
jgi:hypothetical protein